MRIHLTLNNHDYGLAKKEAGSLGIPVAEFVRRAIRQMLPPKRDAPGMPSWMRYAGLVASGDANSSQSIDELVYGS